MQAIVRLQVVVVDATRGGETPGLGAAVAFVMFAGISNKDHPIKC